MERFLEVEKSSLNETDKQINLLKKYLCDYKILQEKLNTLPNEFSYNIMVPFGTVGFMPGQLIHTNEVRILLGDDWFLEISAYHAVNIIQRRNAKLEEQIIALKKQNTLIEQRINYASQQTSLNTEDNNIIEIKEEYNEDAELLWKKEHKENLKKYHQNLAQEKIKIPENLSSDFWEKYVDEENEDEIKFDDKNDAVLKRRVSFGKDIMSTSVDNDLMNTNENNNFNLRDKTIFFSHSNHKPIDPLKITDSEINSPADILKNYHIIPKSILKKQLNESQALDETVIKKPQALDESIIDKVIDPKEQRQQDLIPPCLSIVVEKIDPSQENITSSILNNQSKKISKFKTSRLNISH